MEDRDNGIDLIDLLFGVLTAVFPPFFVLALAQYCLRRSSAVGTLLARHLPPPIRVWVMPHLWRAPLALPAPPTYTLPVSPATGAGEEKNSVDGEVVPASLVDELDKLPALVRFAEMLDGMPTPLSIPLGVSAAGKRYVDLGRGEAQNIGVYGGTGTGKDTLLMAWFAALAANNPPEQTVFAVLDGKGHWLTPNLKTLKHMFMPPAGGFGEQGVQQIKAAIERLMDEGVRREKLIFGQGFRSRDSYVQATGQALPIVVVYITDGVDAVSGEVESLLVSLASKGRALGFRIVVSMQTPTRRDQRWRINLGTVLCGPMQDRSQDAPALGLREDAILYRPSLLPPPTTRRGCFVVRQGGEQFLVQAPLITDVEFDELVEQLPKTVLEAHDLLDSLLASTGASPSPPPPPPASTVAAFLHERCEPAEERVLTSAIMLYNEYCKWARQLGAAPVSLTRFGMDLKELGVQKVKTNQGRVGYVGVRVKRDAERKDT